MSAGSNYANIQDFAPEKIQCQSERFDSTAVKVGTALDDRDDTVGVSNKTWLMLRLLPRGEEIWIQSYLLELTQCQWSGISKVLS